jgi:Cu-processing system permease protein
MIDLTNVRIIAHKELRDALRNKWLLIYTLIFGGLALMLSTLARPEVRFAELASYNRTVTSLVNLVLLFVPLIGLMFGATSLAGERETGVLGYLLAQPVTRMEVLLGKYSGMAAALFLSLLLGFGAAGLVLAIYGGGERSGYILTLVFACLLALAALSLGFMISTLTHKTSTALGAALFVWLLLVFVGDLGLIGTAIVTQMPIETTFLLAALNPLQAFKMGSIYSVQASLEVLGPGGMYATETFGGAFLWLLASILGLWIVLPLGTAAAVFAKREEG